jgi:plasmid stability protein
MHASRACTLGGVTNVQVRDVPESVVAALRQAASRRGESLQGYLTDVLTEQAHIDITAAVLADAATDAEQADSAPFDAEQLVRAARDERAETLTARYTGPSWPTQ